MPNESQNIRNILIVDDHPMTVESYVNLLASLERSQRTNYHLAYSCENAYDIIMKLANAPIEPDIAFLDVNLPPFPARNLTSGIDLAILIREKFPLCKVVIITMHTEPVWVNRIVNSINPEGFISKSEINHKTFPRACEQILRGEFFYTPSITDAQKFLLRRNLQLDEYDIRIIALLFEGKKTINLPEHIGLSLSSIEKRKANMKKQLIFEGGSDQDLITVARNIGLL